MAKFKVGDKVEWISKPITETSAKSNIPAEIVDVNYWNGNVGYDIKVTDPRFEGRIFKNASEEDLKIA